MEEHLFSPDPAAAHTFLFLPWGLKEMTHCKVPFICEEHQDPASRLDRQWVSGCPEQGSGRPGEEDGYNVSIQGDEKVLRLKVTLVT